MAARAGGALNKLQKDSAISKELLVTNMWGEGTLVKELLLGSHQRRIKSIWSKNL